MASALPDDDEDWVHLGMSLPEAEVLDTNEVLPGETRYAALFFKLVFKVLFDRRTKSYKLVIPAAAWRPPTAPSVKGHSRKTAPLPRRETRLSFEHKKESVVVALSGIVASCLACWRNNDHSHDHLHHALLEAIHRKRSTKRKTLLLSKLMRSCVPSFPSSPFES